MKIAIPENIDLSRCKQYILTIEVHPQQFSFSLYNPIENSSYFYYQLPKDKQKEALSAFQDFFFDNDFFTLSFRKIFIINYSSVFTYIPTLIFDEKDKNEYMQFIFVENLGKILCQDLQKFGITILHEISDEAYNFFQRSFVNPQFVHHTASVISYFQEKGQLINGNWMIVNNTNDGIDIFCFAQNNLLLGNHFACSSISDAIYYVLFIWKQLKMNQLKDFVYIAGNKKELIESLQTHIHNIIPVNIIPTEHFEQVDMGSIPFEMASLSLCEI
jgi:hypothetical protein